MKKYDGWVCKDKRGSFLIHTFARTRKEVIENYEGPFRVGNWKACRESGIFKMVKVNLTEID